jgi:hypothetical protein
MAMQTYRCDGCGMTNRAINDLTGMRHTYRARKPSHLKSGPQESACPMLCMAAGTLGRTRPGCWCRVFAFLATPGRSAPTLPCRSGPLARKAYGPPKGIHTLCSAAACPSRSNGPMTRWP